MPCIWVVQTRICLSNAPRTTQADTNHPVTAKEASTVVQMMSTAHVTTNQAPIALTITATNILQEKPNTNPLATVVIQPMVLQVVTVDPATTTLQTDTNNPLATALPVATVDPAMTTLQADTNNHLATVVVQPMVLQVVTVDPAMITLQVDTNNPLAMVVATVNLAIPTAAQAMAQTPGMVHLTLMALATVVVVIPISTLLVTVAPTVAVMSTAAVKTHMVQAVITKLIKKYLPNNSSLENLKKYLLYS